MNKISKVRTVVEKAHKNQLKIAVSQKDDKTKKYIVQHCKLNFSRTEDKNEFEKEFKSVLDLLKPVEETEKK